jgi:hypothetical protein
MVNGQQQPTTITMATTILRVKILSNHPQILRQQVRLIGDDPPSKQICFSLGMRGSMALKMLLFYRNDASP